jgi:hypothetical protein
MTLAGWLELQKQIPFGDDNKKSECLGRYQWTFGLKM